MRADTDTRHTYSNTRHTNTDSVVHPDIARVRRHHDAAWVGMGADQPQHDDRDNRMVPRE
jgi:hypothetical protein